MTPCSVLPQLSAFPGGDSVVCNSTDFVMLTCCVLSVEALQHSGRCETNWACLRRIIQILYRLFHGATTHSLKTFLSSCFCFFRRSQSTHPALLSTAGSLTSYDTTSNSMLPKMSCHGCTWLMSHVLHEVLIFQERTTATFTFPRNASSNDTSAWDERQRCL